MCTVTFLPQDNNNYILTSNRDEFIHRSPEELSTQYLSGTQLVFPRDKTAGGTWIAASSTDRVICILNGAFQNHHRKPPYRRSRGLMALDFFAFPSVNKFVDQYQFNNMEPFTVIACEGVNLYEVIWDGKTVTFNKPNNEAAHIWSSSTLYDDTIKKKRQGWFEDWQAKANTQSLDQIMKFHTTAGDGDRANDVLMARSDNFCTVSITNIIRSGGVLEMRYHDLLNGHSQRYSH